MTDRIIVRTLAGDVFRLNLDNLNIVYTQESPRHIDHFSTEFSFPFEFHVDRDLMVILGSLTHIPLAPQTVFDNCLHVVDGRIRPAKLTILKSVGRVVHAQVDAGFAQLSTWDIKLQDLALDVVQNPLQDAPSKINLAWPAVNYNYPALHTDIYNDEPMMSEFRGTYNLRQGSEFVQNTQVVNSNIYNNYNIVVPMPYWLHVLDRGFDGAGFELHGDVLNDERIQQAILVPSKKIKLFNRPATVLWAVGEESRESIAFGLNHYLSEQHINHHGTFRIRGYITPNFTNTGQMSTYFAPQIKFNGQLIWIAQTPAHILFDFTVNSLPNQTNVLEFSMFTGNIGDDYALLAEIIPLTLLDEEGNPYPALADLTNYQLATLLPDITFGQFVRLTKNLFNLNLDLRNDKEIHMDYTQSGFDTTNVADMSQYEVQNPERTYHQDLSFLLSYAEVAESEDTNYQLFYNRNGSATQNFIATESTKEIDIAAVPLQFHNRNNLYTAHQKAESSTVMHIASYAGLSNGLNTTLSADRWRLDVIFQKYWRRWLYHRVHSSSVKWNFVTLKNHIKNLHILQVIHAYNCRMFIKNITKTSRNARVYEVEIETDVVKD